MATVSNRDGMGNALVALLGTIIDPNTTQPVFSLIKYGAVFNPDPATQWAQVTHFEGDSGPWGSGGSVVGWRIQDEVLWLITCGFGPYQTNDSTAQHNMNYAVDLVKPVLHAHFEQPQAGNPTLPVPGVFDIRLGKDRSIARPYPNGNVYLLWHQPITVKQQYSIALQVP